MVQVPWNLFLELLLTRWYSLEWALTGGSVQKGCIFCTFGVQKGREMCYSILKDCKILAEIILMQIYTKVWSIDV